MGIWTGIKHALNSTVGTEDFQPLNELTEKIIHKYTLGSKKYVASNDLIINYLPSGEQYIGAGQNIFLGNFTPAIDGYIRFNFTLSASSSQHATSFTVQEQQTGNFVIQVNMYGDFSTSGQAQFKDIRVTAGYTYIMNLSQSSAGNGTLSQLNICGYVSDPLYDYTIGG